VHDGIDAERKVEPVLSENRVADVEENGVGRLQRM
jgi:hypothetical protein